MHVLVAEDDDLLAGYLRLSLRKAGHVVDSVFEGNSAERNILTRRYDVIVLDILLPYKNGLDICQHVRSQGITTPIIILSSQDSEDSRINGLDAGADDYMTKPFSFPELEARMRALLRRPKLILDENFKYKSVRICFNRHKIWVADTEILLRAKEFAVIEYLVRNKDRIITREELLNNIWGIHAENASNRVDACVKEIRSKLGKDMIRTVHGTGYALNT